MNPLDCRRHKLQLRLVILGGANSALVSRNLEVTKDRRDACWPRWFCASLGAVAAAKDRLHPSRKTVAGLMLRRSRVTMGLPRLASAGSLLNSTLRSRTEPAGSMLSRSRSGTSSNFQSKLKAGTALQLLPLLFSPPRKLCDGAHGQYVQVKVLRRRSGVQRKILLS